MSELENLHNEETNDTSYDHVLKYTGVFGGVQGLKMLMSFARNKLTSVFLGEFGLGLISVYNRISDFLISASNLGIPLNATQKSGELFEDGTADEIEHLVMVIRTWVLWTAVLSTLLCVCASPILSYFFFEKEWNHYWQVLMVIPISSSFLLAEGECAILKGLRQVKKIAIIESCVALLTLALTVPFYFLPMSRADPESAIHNASLFVMNAPSVVSINRTSSYPMSLSFCTKECISPYFDLEKISWIAKVPPFLSTRSVSRSRA